MISISFDDGGITQYDGFTYMRARGLRGTMYPVINWIGTTGFLTMEQLREMAVAGWEIGSHSVSHPDLTKLTPEELDYELRESKRLLEEGTGSKVTTLAYPGGAYNATVIAAAKKYYTGARRIWQWPFVADETQLNFPPVRGDNRYKLISPSFEVATIDQMKSLVDLAEAQNAWLIVHLYVFVPELIDYLVETGAKVVTVAEGLALPIEWLPLAIGGLAPILFGLTVIGIQELKKARILP